MKRHAGVLFLICSITALFTGGCNRSELAREYQPVSAADAAGQDRQGAAGTVVVAADDATHRNR